MCGVSRSTIKRWVSQGKVVKYGYRNAGGLKKEGLVTEAEARRVLKGRGLVLVPLPVSFKPSCAKPTPSCGSNRSHTTSSCPCNDSGTGHPETPR